MRHEIRTSFWGTDMKYSSPNPGNAISFCAIYFYNIVQQILLILSHWSILPEPRSMQGNSGFTAAKNFKFKMI